MFGVVGNDAMLAYLFWYAFARGWTARVLHERRAAKAL